jgi:hypothetical protein
MKDPTILLNPEQQNTIRFQLAYGVGMLGIALVTFWVCSQYQTVDLRYAFFFVSALVALTWLLNGLTMLSDVFITLLKIRQ